MIYQPFFVRVPQKDSERQDWQKKYENIKEFFKIIYHQRAFHIRQTRIAVILHLAAIIKSSKRLIRSRLKNIENGSFKLPDAN